MFVRKTFEDHNIPIIPIVHYQASYCIHFITKFLICVPTQYHKTNRNIKWMTYTQL